MKFKYNRMDYYSSWRGIMLQRLGLGTCLFKVHLPANRIGWKKNKHINLSFLKSLSTSTYHTVIIKKIYVGKTQKWYLYIGDCDYSSFCINWWDIWIFQPVNQPWNITSTVITLRWWSDCSWQDKNRNYRVCTDLIWLILVYIIVILTLDDEN